MWRTTSGSGRGIMSQRAQVTSIEVLRDFKVGLAVFCEDAAEALCAIEIEIRRTLDWLEHDRLNYWQNEIRHRREEVAQALTDLNRVKLARSSGHMLDCIEQKQALPEA